MARRLEVPANEIIVDRLLQAVEVLKRGGVVALPTETVYGLGVVAENPEAVERLVALKRRPPEKPFSYHVAGVDDVARVVADLPLVARRLAERYWPGPLTLVVPRGPGSDEMVGIRVPAHPVANQLISLVGEALFVPSANPSGDPPATTADEVEAYFSEELEVIVDSGPVQLKQSSTVIEVTDHNFNVLREGIITREMVHQLVVGRRFLFVCTGNTCRSPMAEALFRKHLAAKLGKSPEELAELGYEISSAGTFAAPGGRASEHAETVVRQHGGDLSGHRARAVTPELLANADRVYALGPSHLGVLEQIAPELAGRFELLAQDGVPDPVGGDLATYDRCAGMIEAAIVEHLSRWS